jgi:carboxymethylenebutenolidase
LDGFFVHPGSGAHPGVIFWPDIAGLREAKRNMARRLAGEGYAVLVVNPYYRDVAGEQFADFAEFIDQKGFQKVRPWREKLDGEAIMRDAEAITGWLDGQSAVDGERGIGTQGYCMGGPFTMWSAAAVPGRVKAAASFHGGGLVREDYDLSPHKLMNRMQASLLIAIAQNDDAKAPEEKSVLREAASAAGRPAVIEVFPADHGWCVPDSPAYDQAAAEQAWSELLKLYKGAL